MKMAEYIEREVAIEKITAYCELRQAIYENRNDEFLRGLQTALTAITYVIPAADVQPIRHGRWIRIIGALYECTECKAKLWLGSMNPADKYHYCWMCGAKMDLPEPPKEVD